VWILKYQNGKIVQVSLEGEILEEGFGFDYTCPKCHFESYVSTVYRPPAGWNCLNCGSYIPNDCLKPRGNYQLPEVRRFTSSTRKARSRVKSSTYQGTPRAARPVPIGAISLSTLAEGLKVEPKKLRSWLRKVGWRKAEEAGSSWIFSPEEAKEVTKSFGT